MTNKKGISLIVLVVTIIIMIILVGAILLELNNQRIAEKAEGAVESSDLQEVQSLASLKWSEAYLSGKQSTSELYDAIIEGLKKELGEEVVAKYEIIVNKKGVEVKLKVVE